MTIKPPFKIRSRLLPALDLPGGVTLSMDKNVFYLDFPQPAQYGSSQWTYIFDDCKFAEGTKNEDKFVDILDLLEMAGSQYEIGIIDRHIPLKVLEWSKECNAALEILKEEIRQRGEDYFEYKPEFDLLCFTVYGEMVKEGSFYSTEDAWERNNDMGSRWVFYPIRVVARNGIIVDFPYLHKEFIGLSVASFKEWLANNDGTELIID
jgi:hypothetical protein